MIQGCRRGERKAQQELYMRTSDRIHGLLLRMTRDPDEAADLLQDTYIRVFERIDQFQGASSLSTWVYRIAVNEARQHFRRRQRQARILRTEVAPPPEADPGEQEAAAARAEVREAVQRLPEDERILIILKYFEGLDYAQIAEIIEKPAGTVASGLNRARRLLREVLESKTVEGKK